MNKANILAVLLIFSFSLTSALTLQSVNQDLLYPGQSSDLEIVVENNLEDDVNDVTLMLNLEDTGFTTIGSSEDSEEEIGNDDKESFNFKLKASADMIPGDYNIHYTLTYENTTKTGSFGIYVGAKTELSYTAELKKNIVGEKGEVSFKIINLGLADINFVKLQIVSEEGFDLLSAREEYIGTVSSDDFENVNFDVLFKSAGANIIAQVTYKDLENQDQKQVVTLPLEVYSREKALELGLIKKSRTIWYLLVIVAIGIYWFWKRKNKKRR